MADKPKQKYRAAGVWSSRSLAWTVRREYRAYSRIIASGMSERIARRVARLLNADEELTP